MPKARRIQPPRHCVDAVVIYRLIMLNHGINNTGVNLPLAGKDFVHNGDINFSIFRRCRLVDKTFLRRHV